MQQHVTVIVVARNGEQYLERTLQGVADNREHIDVLVVVDAESTDSTRGLLNESAPQFALSVGADASFAEAVGVGVFQSATVSPDDGWIWILHDDSAPESGALGALLAAVESAPSVGVAGPKVVSWTDRGMLREFGLTTTRNGRRIALARDERDQSQFDSTPDVLAVGTAGMLVRRDVWAKLGGLDQSLSYTDDGLDFGVRAHLAGYRVIRVAAARVAHAEGEARHGTRVSTRFRDARWAQLYRRLSAARGLRGFWRWLMLLPTAAVASVGHLLAKHPGRIPGELAAGVSVAGSFRKVRVGRRRFASSRVQSWSSLEPFFATRTDVAQARTEERLHQRGGSLRAEDAPEPFRYWSTPVPWLILVGAILGLIVWYGLLGAAALSGGGAGALSAPIGQLWHSALATYTDSTNGVVAPPDAFAWVLALLGSVTFWQPSLSLVALYLVAFPMAALGGGLAVGRIVRSSGAAALGSVLWMLAPPFLAALSEGRIGAVLVHLLIPFVGVLVVSGCSRLLTTTQSLSCFAGAAVLLALILASAPSVTPIAVVLLVAVIVARPRLTPITVWTVAPGLALIGPTIHAAWQAGDVWRILADPGFTVTTAAVSTRRVLVGQPEPDPLGIDAALQAFGLPSAPWLTVVPLAVLAVLAVCAFLSERWRTTAWGWGLALIGTGGALVASRFAVVTAAGESVPVWAGTSLSVAFFGVTIAAATVIAVKAAGAPLAWLAGIGTLIVSVPWVVSAVTMGTAVSASSGQSVPAIVRAAAGHADGAQLMVVSGREDGTVGVRLTDVTGAVLDRTNTIASTEATITPRFDRVATTTGNLVTGTEDFDYQGAFAELGVYFVLYTASADDDGSVVAALRANPALSYIGDTDFGELWSVNDATGGVPANEVAWPQLALRAGVLIVFALLAIPTSRPQRFVVSTDSVLRQPLGGDDDDE